MGSSSPKVSTHTHTNKQSNKQTDTVKNKHNTIKHATQQREHIKCNNKFVLHMILPVGCLITIFLAYFVATKCCVKKIDVARQSLVKETASKAVILVVLLLYPGLSTWVCVLFGGEIYCRSVLDWKAMNWTSLLFSLFSFVVSLQSLTIFVLSFHVDIFWQQRQ